MNMNPLVKISFFAFAIANYAYSLYVFYKLYYFFKPSEFSDQLNKLNLVETIASSINIPSSLLQNLLLAIWFISSHSFMARIKYVFREMNLEFIQRAVYILVTSLSLHMLVDYWRYDESKYLWIISRESPYHLIFNLVYHFWGLVLALKFFFGLDNWELMGISQVMEIFPNGELPQRKDEETIIQERLYQKMRHPVFMPLFFIFWFTTEMSFSRFFLSLIFTLYLVYVNDLNDRDAKQVFKAVSNKYTKSPSWKTNNINT